jgi:hypothetical protein
MADLIRLDEIVKKLKEKKKEEGVFKYVYRKSALEMNDVEVRELIDDIDEITTCLVEEIEGLKKKLKDMEKLNTVYVDLMRKLVELIVISDDKESDRVLVQIREWIAEEKRKS